MGIQLPLDPFPFSQVTSLRDSVPSNPSSPTTVSKILNKLMRRSGVRVSPMFEPANGARSSSEVVPVEGLARWDSRNLGLVTAVPLRSRHEAQRAMREEVVEWRRGWRRPHPSWCFQFSRASNRTNLQTNSSPPATSVQPPVHQRANPRPANQPTTQSASTHQSGGMLVLNSLPNDQWRFREYGGSGQGSGDWKINL